MGRSKAAPLELREYFGVNNPYYLQGGKSATEPTTTVICKMTKHREKLICFVIRNLVMEPSLTNVQLYLQSKITFQEWCKYVHRVESATVQNEGRFIDIGKALQISLFHSENSLFWLASFLDIALKHTHSNTIVAIETGMSFTEACLCAQGVSILCLSRLKARKLCAHCIVASSSVIGGSSSAVCCSLSASYIPNMYRTRKLHPDQQTPKILLCDLNIEGLAQESRNKYLTAYAPSAEIIVFYGPISHLPLLHAWNLKLFEEYNFHRRMFSLDAIAQDHCMFFGSESSSCAIIYFKEPMKNIIPTSNLLDSPISILRQYFIRSAVDSKMKKWFKYILPSTPLRVLLKHIPLEHSSLVSDCVEFFSTAHDEDVHSEDEALLTAFAAK